MKPYLEQIIEVQQRKNSKGRKGPKSAIANIANKLLFFTKSSKN